jgi:bacteriocin-like protein
VKRDDCEIPVKRDDCEIPVKRDDCERLAAELSDEELNLIQGGGPFSDEELGEVKGIVDDGAKHHGVNLSAMFIQAGWGTALSFGANAAGEAAGKKVKKVKNGKN